MTEVLQVSSAPPGQSYYRSSNLRRSPPSSSSLFLDPIPLPAGPKSTPALPIERTENFSAASFASSSSPSTSPDRATSDSSSVASPRSTPASSTLSLSPKIHGHDDDGGGHDLDFPHYDEVRFDGESHDYGTPPSSPSRDTDSTDDVDGSMTSDTISDTPLHTPTVVDDTAVKQEPSRQVDFLSHDWRIEDIWASWRHIVSQRKSVYGEKSRLENASWRTWAKSKYNLRTVAPEKLNWLKESDVTWLYGPLTPAASYPITHDVSEPASQISKNNSFINKKPILKKRSMSEVMLQRSLSNSSLVKQAAASVQAQGRRSRKFSTASDCIDSKFQSEIPSRDQPDYFNISSSSSSSTPCENQEKKHIRFDDVVEQCIAVDVKDVAADDDDSDSEDETFSSQGSDSSSDDGLVMKRKKRPGPGRDGRCSNKGSRSNSFTGRRIIETLPATTLKYRTDSPDITNEAQHHTFSKPWNSGQLSPSPSQETLRPSNPAANFLLPEEDHDLEFDSGASWSFGSSNPKSSLGTSAGAIGHRDPTPVGRVRSSTGPNRDQHHEIEGMRRTGSGMFMPYSDRDDDASPAGFIAQVGDILNTAKDIGHVIWNVGWRK